MRAWPIRDATDDDRPRVHDIFWRASLTNEGDRAVILASEEPLLPEAYKPGRRARVATEDGGTIVGFATVFSSDKTSELEDLFVDPDWMRHGIATALVDDAVEHARAQGIARIEVDGNHHAIAFYESTGFLHDREVATPLGGTAVRMHRDIP